MNNNIIILISMVTLGFGLLVITFSNEESDKNWVNTFKRIYEVIDEKRSGKHNTFKTVTQASLTQGVNKQVVKKIVVAMNRLLTEKEKHALKYLNYDLKRSLHRFFAQYSDVFNRERFTNGHVVFLCWLLKQVAHNEYADKELQATHFQQFAEYVDKLKDKSLNGIKKQLGEHYDDNKEIIECEYNNFEKGLKYHFKVLQSDPLVPFFKDSITKKQWNTGIAKLDTGNSNMFQWGRDDVLMNKNKYRRKIRKEFEKYKWDILCNLALSHIYKIVKSKSHPYIQFNISFYGCGYEYWPIDFEIMLRTYYSPHNNDYYHGWRKAKKEELLKYQKNYGRLLDELEEERLQELIDSRE